ncbi:uncharacterized protein LOC143059556 [Mytilus galloprovincialis]|uniref:uncharacterized protein LOC143059556 n=1 Tax=Mytilus galloprovincialis TaxID=29158 RepID=UPI003F7CC31A
MRYIVLFTLLCTLPVVDLAGSHNHQHNDCSSGSDTWQTCYDCHCNHEYSAACNHCRHCDIQCPDKTNPPITTQVPLTTMEPHTSLCDIVKIFDAVARNQFIHNAKAAICQNDNEHHDNDALVMTLCNAPVSANWIEGKQVLLSSGTCSHSAKPYTPIFYHLGNVRRAGILISCDGNEIKYFHQECDTTPVVKHVNSTQIDRIHVLTWT